MGLFSQGMAPSGGQTGPENPPKPPTTRTVKAYKPGPKSKKAPTRSPMTQTDGAVTNSEDDEEDEVESVNSVAAYLASRANLDNTNFRISNFTSGFRAAGNTTPSPLEVTPTNDEVTQRELEVVSTADCLPMDIGEPAPGSTRTVIVTTDVAKITLPGVHIGQGDAEEAITSESEVDPVSTDENALASEGDLQPRFHPAIRPEEETPTPSQEDEEIPDPEAGYPVRIQEVSHKHVQTPPVARLLTEALPGTSSDLVGSQTPRSTTAPTPPDTPQETQSTSGRDADRESKTGKGKHPCRHNKPTIKEASSRVWHPTSQQKFEPYRQVNQRRLATYRRKDPYVCVVSCLPNNAMMFHYYNRLKSTERPVENLLIGGEYGNPRYKPTKYAAETLNFYRFVTKDHNEDTFFYMVHKQGWLPDPLARVPPANRQRDGFLADVFPQFAAYIESDRMRQRRLEARMDSKK